MIAQKAHFWPTARQREIAEMITEASEDYKCCDRLGVDCDGFFGCDKPDGVKDTK
jgi:hypothetical protein